MPPRTWALVGGSIGTTLAAGFLARPLSTNNRVYTSVRKEMEFEPLLTLPNPLLANFCIYTDPLSKKVSSSLQNIVNGETPRPLSTVDIEADEPAVADLISRYAVNQIPMVLALQGGNAIGKFYPKDGPKLEEELREWIAKLK